MNLYVGYIVWLSALMSYLSEAFSNATKHLIELDG